VAVYGVTVKSLYPFPKAFSKCWTDEVFEGDAAIVTVPLGVLKAGIIKFVPPLPPWKAEAIRELGFGTLNKVHQVSSCLFCLFHEEYAVIKCNMGPRRPTAAGLSTRQALILRIELP
jgi:hypothetical protein